MSRKNRYSTVFQTPFFKIEQSDKKFGNSDLPYFRLSGNDSVIAAIFDMNGNIILVNQFRENLNKETIEFPAGEIDKGETSIEAVKREVLEETGYNCKYINLGLYRLLLNRTNMQHHLFIGFEANKSKLTLREDNIKAIKMSRKQFKSNILEYNKLEHLAALGILFLIEKKVGCNILDDEWLEIHKKLSYKYINNDQK